MPYTLPADVPGIVARARENYSSCVTLPVEFRLRQLHAIVRLLDDNVAAISEAMAKVGLGGRQTGGINLTACLPLPR